MIERSHIDSLLAQLPELEARLSAPDTAADQKLFRKLVREHAALRRLSDISSSYFELLDEVQGHRELLADEDADADLQELAQEELRELEPRLPVAEKRLMVALLPADPDESRNAIVEIRAGTGGNEAALFGADLFRMYSRFAEARGWKINVIDASPSEIGGYKEVVFGVEGPKAYGTLRYESGGHRVQRVPVTESQGRIHTSAATVAVFPEAEPEDDITISPDEIRIDIFRSSGPGGQSVNTTDSAVRIIHLPTGLVVQCQDEKSQQRNREKAMTVLKARILDKKRLEDAEKMGSARRQLIGSGDRSERVRTYNFPQNRITDHRVNLTLYSLDRAIEGEIGELTAALRERDLALCLELELKKLDAGSR